MSFWNQNPRETDVEIADSLVHTPSGGRPKMWLLGVGLALVPVVYGLHCWDAERAVFWGTNGGRLELTGSAALSMAIAYLAIGGFIHAHWFWGLHPRLLAWSPVLKVLALGVFLVAFGKTVYGIIAS